MHESLADFLEVLERAGQLRRVSEPVDAELEIAAASLQQAEAGGPALLFENVRGQRVPVATNLLATERRLCLAMGVGAVEEMAQRMRQWLDPGEPGAWIDKLKPAAGMTAPGKSVPRLVKAGPCQQVVRLGRDVDLAEIPALRCWPLEQRRWLTAGRIWTRNPQTGQRDVETAPVEILARDRLGIAWHELHPGTRHLALHAAAGTAMPVAISLGGDPLSALWARPSAAALPREVEPLALAAVLRGQPLDMVRCRTQDLEVPADADLVLEGTIDPAAELPAGGPVAGEAGYYAPARPLAPVQVTAVTQRINPIVPATVPGSPGAESCVVAGALARFFLPLVQRAIPELVDYCLRADGGPGGAAVLAIRKTFPQQARKAAAAFWGLEHLMCRKLLIVVDEGVDVHDPAAVLRALAANLFPGRDAFFHQGPAHPLDHAAPTPRQGHHLALDATAKLAGEHPGPWPARLEA